MHASIVTLFPELFEPFLRQTVLGRAVEDGLVRVDVVHLREFGEGRHKMVDDRPFGGGPGMVLLAEPVVKAVEAARASHGDGVRTFVLSPQGRRFDQRVAEELAAAPDGFVLVCGRYEGIDERALEVLQPEELSLGDFVLSGGEAAALAVIDATARLVPGVLGHECSTAEDSFSNPEGLLDHPHYTRPATWRGLEVPPELLTGNHAAIAAWRLEQARKRTAERRPDLLAGGEGEA
ncbi:MAG: tRNA (guanosine(37)-N1)-methyltransferase TrmD [Planctomycetota bacterium]|nr:tRNA (guanosine(37)-N1)-methyltransferase TrmD [Planctomycetota bacterium]